MNSFLIKIISLLLLCSCAYGAQKQVKFSDYQSAEWVEIEAGRYRLLWSDIGGVVPPVATDLVLEWLSGSATNAIDTSGNGLDGTATGLVANQGTNGMFTGGTWWSEFDAGSTKISNSDISDANISDEMTIMFMANPSDTDGDIVNYAGSFSSKIEIRMGGSYSGLNSASANIAILDNDAGNFRLSTEANTWTDANSKDRWRHVILRLSRTNSADSAIFIDGVKQNLSYSNTFTSAFNTSTNWIWGERGNGAKDYFGSLSGLYIYNALISDADCVSTSVYQRADAGTISDYLTANTNTYWNDTVVHIGHNNILQDGSPNNLTNATTSAPDLKGTTSNGWAYYDGAANYVSYGLINDINTNIYLTISAWVRPHETGRGDYVNVWNTGPGDKFNLLQGVSAGKFDFYASPSAGGVDNVGASGVFVTNEWYHLCGIINSNIISYYTNGTLVGSSDMGSVIKTVNITEHLFIGDNTSGGENVNADIDDVDIFKRAFSPSEVTNLYTTTKANLGH